MLFGLLYGIPFGLATNNYSITILLTLLPAAFGYFEGWINEKYFDGSIIQKLDDSWNNEFYHWLYGLIERYNYDI